DKVNRIKEFAENPEAINNHLVSQTDGITDHLPNVSQNAITMIARAAQFLNSKIPRPVNQFATSQEWEPSPGQKEKFNEYFNAVHDPISILDSIKDGTLSNVEIESIATVHPKLYEFMKNIITQQLSTQKAKNLSEYVKSSLSQFLGMPISESTYQPVAQFNQAKFQVAQAQ